MGNAYDSTSGDIKSTKRNAYSISKKLEKALMHTSNRNLYKKGVISYEVFSQAKARIDRL